MLRYFNPVGAHPSGNIGENPNGVPNNLTPFIAQVAVGKRAKLNVFGNDYETPDGTGVRDFVHVMDLAEGHVATLKYMESKDAAASWGVAPLTSLNAKYDQYTRHQGYGRLSTFNLGTGQGHSVLEMVREMELASQRPIPYEFAPRREGDIAVCYADTTRANSLLNWRATRDVKDMCRDLWNWQSKNPNGYAK